MSSDDGGDEHHSAVRTTTVALVVRFVDVTTGRPPTTVRGDRPEASFEGFDGPSHRTDDGYDVFVAIPSGEPTIRVDPGDRFFAPPESVVTGEVRTASLPVIDIPLEPTPAYEFPRGTTLVRGVVREPPSAAGAEAPPIAGTTVKLVGPSQGNPDPVEVQTTTTTDAGEFVLFLPAEGAWAVDTSGDTPKVTIEGSDPSVAVTVPPASPTDDPTVATVELTLFESKTTAVALTLDGGTLSVERVTVRS